MLVCVCVGGGGGGGEVERESMDYNAVESYSWLNFKFECALIVRFGPINIFRLGLG